MADSRCSSCGAVLSHPIPAGIACPRCLLRLGFAERDSQAPTAIEEEFLEPEEASADARFLPGQLLLGRYRIVAPLGRGGMGEVYRADDLKLGEPVALKFLPERFERDPVLLSRLLNEVKIARRISHANVCRVFDIEEVDGHHFLSMEYVDGEDLASLLRRIGRLPRDRAVSIAHQLFAGLAAAHRCGVLHRDIKPANVMIDGRGRVRIMDFGLAEILQTADEQSHRAGTPAYMAPEQSAGLQVTERSDLYSLGLLLYEMFTGRHPFVAAAATSPTAAGRATPPSMYVRGLDRRVEAVILRCLDPDPERRPPSALVAAATLPGGDPISAMVAARETPPPDVVANAADLGGLRRRVAWAWLIAVIGLVIGVVLLSSRTQLTRLTPLERSVDVLHEQAREVVTGLGYTDSSGDRLFGFDYDPRVLEWDRLATRRLSPISFWYRQSPEYLVRRDIADRRASYDDPPWTVAGMIGVHLDPQGRLLQLDAVPLDFDRSSGRGREPDWHGLLRLAGFEPSAVAPVEPRWVPRAFADDRRAWKGGHPHDPSIEVRIEAAAHRGRVVGFRIQGPWSGSPGSADTVAPTPMFSSVRTSFGGTWERGSRLVYLGMLVVGLFGGALVARSNLRAGRGHPAGALRLALYLLVTGMLIWLLGSHHVPTSDELKMFVHALAGVLFWSFVAWLFYVAVEPYLRRIWPRTMVSWIRLLEGRLRDPLVGRDLLFGCAIGIGLGLILQLYQVIPEWLGLPPPRPDRLNVPTNELQALRGFRHSLAGILTVHWKQTFYALLYGCVLLVLKLLLRQTWLAVLIFMILGSLLTYRAAGHPIVDLALAAALTGICVATFFRLGLLPVVVALTVSYLSGAATLTLDLSSWYAHGSVLLISLYLGLAFYGFQTSLAGRGLFGDALLRE